MARYAQDTRVPVSQSLDEIKRMVLSRGAGQFMQATDYEKGTAIVGWSMSGRMVRLTLPLPPLPSEPTNAVRNRWEKIERSRWRSLVLIVKAKIIAIEDGISTFEREFLADTVMHDGGTVGAWLQPQLEAMYKTGKMPSLLPAHKGD